MWQADYEPSDESPRWMPQAEQDGFLRCDRYMSSIITPSTL